MASSIRMAQRVMRPASTTPLASRHLMPSTSCTRRSLPARRHASSTSPETATTAPTTASTTASSAAANAASSAASNAASKAASDAAAKAAPSPAPSASSSSSSSYSSSRAPSYSGGRAKAILYATTLAIGGYMGYLYATDTRAAFHRWGMPPLMRTLFPDAEDAHNAAVSSMKALYAVNMHPRERTGAGADAALGLSVFGHPLANPVAISAGLDKHAEIPDVLFALGAGVVEVGGCTPLPQEGNPKPRMFRVPGLDGLINRYGLNSHGADDMAMRLRNRVRLYARSVGLSEAEVLNGEANVPPGSLKAGRLLAVQVAKNKATPDQDVSAISRDYTYCVARLAPYADILVVNVSSPNTPGLRDLQAVEPLTQILTAVVDEARRADRATRPKVMVKVSPDEDEDAQMEGIVQAVWRSGVDGVIVGNTTKRRQGVVPPGVGITPHEAATLTETGGYSGPAMFERTLNLVGRYRKMLDGQSLALTEAGPDGTRDVRDDKRAIDDEAVSASVAGVDGSPTGIVESAARIMTKQPAASEPGRDQKVIFASGGITNGQQALQILNAGASVAMIYTAFVYGGAGTITRMKREMQQSVVQDTA